jgi:hypothetical protein
MVDFMEFISVIYHEWHIYNGYSRKKKFFHGIERGNKRRGIFPWDTIWLFNSSPWKTTMLLIGKPSISMGHLYHGYVK